MLLVTSLALMLGLSPAAAQTQAKMNESACAAYKKADIDLNQVYGQILKTKQEETTFVQALRAAQRAWLAFRDAHVKALYPETDPASFYGSSYASCRCALLEKLTRERTDQLRKPWIEGVAEGDVCAGSSAIRR